MCDFPKYLDRLRSGEKAINPFLDFMGMILEELGDGCARFRMPIRHEFLQGAGVVQGGLIVAMASETIAHAVMTLLGPGERIDEVYQLAADMGGMGFIQTAECEIMRNSALININMIHILEINVQLFMFLYLFHCLIHLTIKLTCPASL